MFSILSSFVRVCLCRIYVVLSMTRLLKCITVVSRLRSVLVILLPLMPLHITMFLRLVFASCLLMRFNNFTIFVLIFHLCVDVRFFGLNSFQTTCALRLSTIVVVQLPSPIHSYRREFLFSV